jgi:hypothetical protein
MLRALGIERKGPFMALMKRCACMGLVAILLTGALIERAGGDEWDDYPSSVRTAKRRYDGAAERASEDCTKAVAKAEDKRATADTVAAKALVRAIKNEAATEADADIKSLLNDVATTVEGILLPDEPTPKEVLEGTWTSTKWQWTFDSNGKVTARLSEEIDVYDTGRWKIADGRVYILWSELMWSGENEWSTLRMPLDESGTIVDDWSAINAFTLTKDGHDDTDTEDTPSLDDIQWAVLPATITQAKTTYDQAVADALTDHDEAVAEAQADYLDELQTAYDKLAESMDAAIKSAERDDDADLSASLTAAKVPLAAAAKGEPVKVDYAKMIVGTWLETKETARGDGYDGRWKFVFKSDKTVACSIKEVRTVATGKWTLTDTHVIVTWSTPRYVGRGYRRGGRVSGSYKAWVALRLPLDPDGTVADSWSGLDAYVFEKQDADD